MFIGCRLGNFEIGDIETLQHTLIECADDCLDDIWLSPSKEEEYPALAILVNRNTACVHYFSGQDMFQSKGDMKAEGMVVFGPGGEESELPAYVAIPLKQAIECAKEFYRTGKRPNCIQWNEL